MKSSGPSLTGDVVLLLQIASPMITPIPIRIKAAAPSGPKSRSFLLVREHARFNASQRVETHADCSNLRRYTYTRDVFPTKVTQLAKRNFPSYRRENVAEIFLDQLCEQTLWTCGKSEDANVSI